MKKLLGFLSIFLTASTAAGSVISCGSGASNTSIDVNEIKLERGAKNYTLTNRNNSVDETISDYKNIVASGYTFKLETLFGKVKTGSNDYDGNYKDSFSVSEIDDNGKFSVKYNDIGTGAVKISASNGIKNLEFYFSVKCKPDLSITNNDGKTPSSITVNAKRDDKPGLIGDGSMEYSASNDFTLNNVKDLLTKGYDISFEYENKYDKSDSVFGSGVSDKVSGSLSLDSESNSINVNDGEKIGLTVDDDVVKFDSEKITTSGTGTLTFSISLTDDNKSDEYKKLSDLGFISDNKYSPDPISISLSSFGYSMLTGSDNVNITSDSGGEGETGNNGNFFKMNTGDSADLTVDLGTKTKSIGSYATVALLIPTDYFTTDKNDLKTIGLSANSINIKNDSDSYNVTIFAKGYDKEDIKIKEGESDFSNNLTGDNGEYTLKITQKMSGTISVSAGSLSSSIEVTADNGNSTGTNSDSKSIAPIVDLSEKSEKATETTSDISGVDTWSLSNATYVNLSVLSSIMQNESEYYAFYNQIDTSNYNNKFNYTITKNNTSSNPVTLSCILSGKFDMTKLLDTQSSSNASGSSIYNEFIDSISSLYLPSNT